MFKVYPTCNPARPPTTLKPPPTTLPGHTCDLEISLYRERTYDPQTSTYDNSKSHLPPAYPLVGSAPTPNDSLPNECKCFWLLMCCTQIPALLRETWATRKNHAYVFEQQKTTSSPLYITHRPETVTKICSIVEIKSTRAISFSENCERHCSSYKEAAK